MEIPLEVPLEVPLDPPPSRPEALVLAPACDTASVASPPALSPHSLSLESFDDESRIARAIAAATASALGDDTVSSSSPVAVARSTRSVTPPRESVRVDTTGRSRLETESVAVDCCCGVMGRVASNATLSSLESESVPASAAAALKLHATETEDCDDDVMETPIVATPKRANHSNERGVLRGETNGTIETIHREYTVTTSSTTAPHVLLNDNDTHTLVTTLTASFEDETGASGVELVIQSPPPGTITVSSVDAAAALPSGDDPSRRDDAMATEGEACIPHALSTIEEGVGSCDTMGPSLGTNPVVVKDGVTLEAETVSPVPNPTTLDHVESKRAVPDTNAMDDLVAVDRDEVDRETWNADHEQGVGLVTEDRPIDTAMVAGSSCGSSVTGPLEVPVDTSRAPSANSLGVEPPVAIVAHEPVIPALETDAWTPSFRRSESTGRLRPESSCCSSVTGPLELASDGILNETAPPVTVLVGAATALGTGHATTVTPAGQDTVVSNGNHIAEGVSDSSPEEATRNVHAGNETVPLILQEADQMLKVSDTDSANRKDGIEPLVEDSSDTVASAASTVDHSTAVEEPERTIGTDNNGEDLVMNDHVVDAVDGDDDIMGGLESSTSNAEPPNGQELAIPIEDAKENEMAADDVIDSKGNVEEAMANTSAKRDDGIEPPVEDSPDAVASAVSTADHSTALEEHERIIGTENIGEDLVVIDDTVDAVDGEGNMGEVQSSMPNAEPPNGQELAIPIEDAKEDEVAADCVIDSEGNVGEALANPLAKRDDGIEPPVEDSPDAVASAVSTADYSAALEEHERITENNGEDLVMIDHVIDAVDGDDDNMGDVESSMPNAEPPNGQELAIATEDVSKDEGATIYHAVDAIDSEGNVGETMAKTSPGEQPSEPEKQGLVTTSLAAKDIAGEELAVIDDALDVVYLEDNVEEAAISSKATAALPNEQENKELASTTVVTDGNSGNDPIAIENVDEADDLGRNMEATANPTSITERPSELENEISASLSATVDSAREEPTAAFNHNNEQRSSPDLLIATSTNALDEAPAAGDGPMVDTTHIIDQETTDTENGVTAAAKISMEHILTSEKELDVCHALACAISDSTTGDSRNPDTTVSTPEKVASAMEINVVSADKALGDTTVSSIIPLEATVNTPDHAQDDGRMVSPLTGDIDRRQAIPAYADFVSQQSVQIRQGRETEQKARQALTSPIQHGETPSVKIEAGTVAPYADFISHQSNQIKLNKEKERATRQALNSPSREKSRPFNVEVGIVAPYNDFVSQQSALIKANKLKERETRQALSSPAQAEYSGKVSGAAVSGMVAPFMDFAAQQSDQIKANRQKERDARQSLSSPAQVSSKGVASLGSGGGVVAPFTDFATQQSAQIKASKEKEREARLSLSMPARASPITPSSTGVVAPFSDFTMQQSAQIKASKDKERETRQEMNRPISGHAIDQHAAELQAKNLEQKRKQKEAQEMMASYRTADASTGDLQSTLAAELKRQQDEQKQKKKEAEEMVLSYRNVDPIATDSHFRLATALKQQDAEEKRKRKEAGDLITTYRATDPSSGDAASRTASQLLSLKQEQAIRKKEADEHMKSYKHSHAGADAASQVAVSISSLREEQRLKKKEAEEMAQAYRTSGVSSGNAQEVVAAELKRQQEIDRQKKREAQELMTGFRDAAPDFSRVTAEGEVPDNVAMSSDPVMTSPRSLDDLKSRTDEELKIMSELRKQHQLTVDVDEGSGLESIKSKTADELAALQGSASNLKSLAQGFDSGFSPNSHSIAKTSAQEELAALKRSGTNLKSLAEEYDRNVVSSTGVDKVKMQTQDELNALQGSNFKARTEEFSRGIQSTSVEKARSDMESELASIQGSSGTMKLAEAFGRGIQSDSIEKVKLKTEQELAALQTQGVTKGTGKVVDMFTRSANDGVEKAKLKSEQELAALQTQGVSKGTGKVAEMFTRSANDGIERAKAQTSDELANLSGRSGGMKQWTAQFNANVNGERSGNSKATNDELQALQGSRGTSAVKERMQQLNQASGNNKLEQMKSSTSMELASLRNGSLRSLTQGFNQGIKSSKVDELKSHAAAELALVQEAQLCKRHESAPVVVASTTPTPAIQFTEAELAVFDQERRAREQELDELKEFASDKKLDALRSKAAAELHELAHRKKKPT